MLIRLATFEDAVHLPRIEKSASELYRTDANLTWLADGKMIAVSEHERLIHKRTVWVAEIHEGDLVGFLSAEVFLHELHIWELSVHADWQRKGMASKLLSRAHQYAVEEGLAALTLTTFKHLPWCAPAYAKLGFILVEQPVQHLRDVLDAEAAHGLPIEQRIAMRLPICGRHK